MPDTEIARYIKKVGRVTIHDIAAEINFGYYMNVHKHVGTVLARMVDNGTLERVKNGVFRIAKPKPLQTDFSKQQLF